LVEDTKKRFSFYAKDDLLTLYFNLGHALRKKKKGDILLSVDKDGYIKKSVIKDILLYGDAKLIRTD